MVSADWPMMASPFSKTISLVTLARAKERPSEKSVPAPPAPKEIPTLTGSSASLFSKRIKASAASVTSVPEDRLLM